MTQTLGDILLSQATLEQTQALSAARQAEAAREARDAENFAKVVRYFDNLKAKITESITAHKRAPHIEVGRSDVDCEVTNLLGLQHFFSDRTCMHLDHGAYPTWLAFCNWAKAQGLKVTWRKEHGSKSNDAGYPEEHWWVLDVTAA